MEALRRLEVQKQEPPPGQEGGSEEGAANASPETVAQPTDTTSRRVNVGDWRRALLTADDLNATARHVALTLAEYMDRDGAGAFPKQTTLAAACRRDVKTIRDALRVIEQAGYLRVRRTGRASRYEAVVPDGCEVIDFPAIGNNARSDRGETPDQIGSLTPPTQPTTQPSTQKRAPTSLTELRQSDAETADELLALGEECADLSPELWAEAAWRNRYRSMYERDGPTATRAAIRKRTAKAQRGRRAHRAPETAEHGPTVQARDDW